MVLVSIYWAWQIALAITNWLALVGIWVFGALLMFELFDFVSKNAEHKLKHSKDLVKGVFEVNISNIGHVEYNNDEITPFYVNWAESSNLFPEAVKHLNHRTYKKTWQAYENGKQYAESIINEIVTKIQQYREVIEQKLTEAKIQILASEEFIDHQTKHYNQKFVKHIIFVDIQHILKLGEKYNELRLNVSASPNFSYLNWGASTFAVAEEDSLKNLQKLIEELEKDETLMDILRKISLLEIRLKDNKELEQFNREREEIIRQVKYGQKSLRGRCDLCP
jgi:hypothetical protein